MFFEFAGTRPFFASSEVERLVSVFAAVLDQHPVHEVVNGKPVVLAPGSTEVRHDLVFVEERPDSGNEFSFPMHRKDFAVGPEFAKSVDE